MKKVNVTDNTIRVVKSTISALEGGGANIAKRMYEIIFAENPSLTKVFNMSHQSPDISPSGDGEQIKILSHALLKYAEHIDDPFTLSDMIQAIVSKHTSLQVKPAHYEVVESALFRAMGDTLGDAFTEEVEREWRTAYWSLSNLLITMESNVYQENEDHNFGWMGSKELVVISKCLESEDTVRVGLARKDGLPLPSVSPGQYISVHSGVLGVTRQYSLISVTSGLFEIGVRAACSGSHKGVMSNYLKDSIELGDTLSVSMPAGGYGIKAMRGDVCLLSAGSGITPNLSLLNHLDNIGFQGEVQHFYSVKNSKHNAFVSDRAKYCSRSNFNDIVIFTDPLPDDQFGFDYQVDGRLDSDLLKKIVRDTIGTSFFVCGPVEFVNDMILIILRFGVPRSQVKFEYFGSTPISILSNLSDGDKPGSKCIFSSVSPVKEVCPV